MTNWDAEIEKLKQKKEAEEKKKFPWKDELLKNSKGKIENVIENYLLYFSESEKYKGKLKYNEFLQQKEFNGKDWDDFNEDIACNDIERDIKLSNVTKIRTALSEIFDKNKYNPVQDYLKSLTWDGEKRIEEVFIKLLDADDTELNRAMSKKWFMAAVKRVMFPGCKFDNILIFQGAQGIGKTTICEKISKGFSNTVLLSEITNKDVIDKLNKTWIGIVDEMDAFSKKDMTTVKTFLSTSVDSARLAYGRNTQSFKRHSVFIGSTNDETFLRDSTSSTERRFWIMESHKEKYTPIVNELLTDEYVDQLWAEAYYELFKDVNQYLDIDNKLADAFAEAQKKHKNYQNDPVIDWVKDILNKPYVLVDGEFNDDNDFLRQFREDNVYTVPKTYLNKVKISSLIYVLKQAYGEVKNAKYLKDALSGEWERSRLRFRGCDAAQYCFVRVNERDEIINNQLVNENLPI